MTGPIAELRVEAGDLKMLHEWLCSAQTGASQYEQSVLGGLLREIERHRPLGPDGKHGTNSRGGLHTPTCGCDEVELPTTYPDT